MKKLLFALALTPLLGAPAFASDDAVECSKKEGKIKCEAKQDHVVVDSISVNGGECDVPAGDKVLHHAYNKGDKFSVPVMGDDAPLPFTGCGYVRTVTVKTHDGKKKTFNAL
ncbi:MAG: hypothetical protein N2444_04635 [Methylocystis sp.]|nr:hypothetical protein [Methylocystis sp.]